MTHNYNVTALNFFAKLAKFGVPILLLVFFGQDLFAAEAQEFRSDASTSFLSVIFGGVSQAYINVLGGGRPNFLGDAFRYYNLAIAVVGVVVVTYITVVALMNSAHSGNPMGKWHSMFLPLRVVVGAGLLIPNSFGYNLAQVTMMWFILTGVQIADNVWDSVTARLEIEGESAISANTGVSADDIISFYTDTVMFAACVGAGADSYPGGTNVNSLTCNPGGNDCNYVQTIEPTDEAIKAKCGSLRINPAPGGALSPTMRHRYATELTSMVISPIIDNVRIAMNVAATNGTSISPGDIYTIATSTWSTVQYGMSIAQSVVLTQEVMNQLNNQNALFAEDRLVGWIAAGASYYKFIKQKDGTTSANSAEGVRNYIIPPSWENSFSGTDAYAAMRTQLINNVKSIAGATNQAGATANQKVKLNISRRSNLVMDIVSLGIRPLTEWVAKKILDPNALFGYEADVDILNPDKLRNNLTVEPLKGISKRGSDLTEFIENIFFITIAVLAAASITAAIIPGLPYILAAIGIIVPVLVGVLIAIVAVTTLFYPVGMIMNIYMPMIPLLIYTFGVIGWLLLCIEALAAGPIVAIGLMHPESNEVLGKAEQGLMLILNLMLRPVLMIIGLCAGIILVRVVLLFFTWSLNTLIATDLLQIRSVGAVVAMLFVYTYSLSMLIQRAFSLINQVPDKLMRWIGSSGGEVGEGGEFVQGARQSVQENAGMAAKMPKEAKSGFSSGHKAGQQAISSNQGPGGGGGGVGGG